MGARGFVLQPRIQADSGILAAWGDDTTPTMTFLVFYMTPGLAAQAATARKRWPTGYRCQARWGCGAGSIS
jgi:hypothetical protein